VFNLCHTEHRVREHNINHVIRIKIELVDFSMTQTVVNELRRIRLNK